MIAKRIVSLLLTASLLYKSAPAAAEEPLKWHPSRVIVQFDSRADQARVQQTGVVAAIAKKIAPLGGLHSLGASERGPLALVTLNSGWSVEQAVQMLNDDPSVLYAEPDYVCSIDLTPDDTNFSSLWALHNTGQSGGTVDADIDAPEAWDITTGDPSIVVAVIDTGVDYTHLDLAANIWTNSGEIASNGIDDDANGYIDDVYGYDFYNEDNNPMDDHSHGTHVAGTIGAVGNNNQGVIGVAWNVKIMSLKFMNSSGSGFTSDAVRAMNYARAMGARVMNHSWDGSSYSFSLEQQIDFATDEDSVVVAAAGNDGVDDLHYPAAYENVIAVAATDRNDSKASYSNYGAYVDIAAPGSSIQSTMPGGGYGGKSGTSMASPHVAGVVALILSVHPEYNSAQVRNVMDQTADPVVSAQYIGSGRVNAAAALSAADLFSVDAGQDTSVALGRQVNLSGSVSDPDNLNGGVFTAAWSKASGPGTVTFGDDTALSTTAGFSAVGTYVLTLTVTGTGASDSDNVVVTVVNNSAPQVGIEGAQTIGVLSPLSLEATASDDGLPDGVITYTWGMESGPAEAQFSATTGAQTQVRFTQEGVYVIQAIGSDGLLFDAATIEITVTAASTATLQLTRNSFNPARGENSEIGFELASPSDVSVILYDRMGREVRNLTRQSYGAGVNIVTWDGRDSAGNLVASGVYNVVLKIGGTVQKSKIIVAK